MSITLIKKMFSLREFLRGLILADKLFSPTSLKIEPKIEIKDQMGIG